MPARSGGSAGDSRRAPVQLPDDVYERVSTLCLALPEVTAQVDYPRVRTRSTSYSFSIRGRSFCLLIAVESSSGKPRSQLVLRGDPVDCDALRSLGHPFHSSHAGPDRVRVVLTDDTDWEEIRDLVIESYRFLAPKKLRPLLDQTSF